MPRALTVGSEQFPSMTAALVRARVILYQDQPGTEVIGEDVPFVEALLAARPDKTLDLQGLNVIGYFRGGQPEIGVDHASTRFFYALLEDGTPVPFSHYEAIKLLAEGTSSLISGAL